MTLYEKWSQKAYDDQAQGQANQKLWSEYLPLEQKFYEKLLESKELKISGKLSELAKQNKMPVEYFCGLLDGIKEALNEPLDIESLTKDSEVNVSTEFDKLYKKMVEYKAEHLYSLPQWKNIFSEERLKELYLEQKRSATITRDSVKIGRNEPCPCGSGKKYKICCALK